MRLRYDGDVRNLEFYEGQRPNDNRIDKSHRVKEDIHRSGCIHRFEVKGTLTG